MKPKEAESGRCQAAVENAAGTADQSRDEAAVTGWTLRVQISQSPLEFAEVGHDKDTSRVYMRVSGGDGWGLGRCGIDVAGAKLFRRFLSRAIRQLEGPTKEQLIAACKPLDALATKGK